MESAYGHEDLSADRRPHGIIIRLRLGVETLAERSDNMLAQTEQRETSCARDRLERVPVRVDLAPVMNSTRHQGLDAWSRERIDQEREALDAWERNKGREEGQAKWFSSPCLRLKGRRPEMSDEGEGEGTNRC